jgi:carboxypeptidase Taq
MATATTTVWQTFEHRMREIEDLGSALSLLSWDEQTYCSARGREARANHLATLSTLLHQRMVDPAYGEAIEDLADDPDGLTEAQRAMVRNVKHDRDRAVRLAPELVRALAESGSRSNQAWEEARRARDFAIFRPHLERMLELKREEADALGHEGERYDALLEAFEPGMRVAQLEPILTGLRDELVPFVARVLAEPAPDASFLAGPFDHDRQLAFSERILRDLGFDFSAGRQDLSTHPFCGGPGPTDVRLTTHVYDSLEPGCLFSSMHECGHGLYEQGMDAAFARTSVGHAPSLGLHESQSRFWENVIGRSNAFWERYLPVAREFFPGRLDGVDPEAFTRAVNRVAASPIRIFADELTYNLHILLRFDLELALLREELEVADLPTAWRDRMESYVGYTPKDDVEGVMQDIHWSWGELGYFPTYSLGNLYASAIREAMEQDLSIDEHVRGGEFGPILGWLRERMHRRGHLLPGEELMQQVTGRPLSHDAFMRYVRGKFGALYGVS